MCSSEATAATAFSSATSSLVPTTPKLVTPCMMGISFLLLTFFPLFPLALCLPLHPFALKLLGRFLDANLGFLQIGRESRMCAVLASWAVWTEASDIERTDLVFLVVF